MILRLSFSVIGALVYAACCAWLLARWLPLAPLDRALLPALAIPLFSVLWFLWLWFARRGAAYWRRLAASGLVLGLALFLSPAASDRPVSVQAAGEALPVSAGLPAAAPPLVAAYAAVPGGTATAASTEWPDEP